MNITDQDRQQLAAKGITEAQLEEELNYFVTGFPYLRLYDAASVGHGIKCLSDEEQQQAARAWQDYLSDPAHRVVKFVPASGAASRMFKALFAFVDASYDEPQTDVEKIFFAHLTAFAFYDELDAACRRLYGAGAQELADRDHRYKDVVRALLGSEGLNYGQLPKGLLKFHLYPDGPRTPAEEHLVEGAGYALGADGTVHIHFTVSQAHMALFQQLIAERQESLEKRLGAQLDITYSVQKPSTDTPAVTPDNELFRQSDGSILFRPGGHGALIENLNDIPADIVFIKNIDNVVPDHLKPVVIKWKQLLAGVLVTLQADVFAMLRRIMTRSCTHDELLGYLNKLETYFCQINPRAHEMDDALLNMYLHKKLNRPIRVCGMVRNQGEPGGGPFLVYGKDGVVSPQILESSQIDRSDTEAQQMFSQGTHFNPVDLVCGLKNYKGEPFSLLNYVDKSTGFISSKSKDGRELKALERPGLWNGAMSDWNTVFVEVPLETFNPVKTVNDLLRPQHQQA